MSQDSWHRPVMDSLRSKWAYPGFVVLWLSVGGVLWRIGARGLAVLAWIFVFLYALDAISMFGWDRLEAYLDENRTGASVSERELTPHRVSRTTKVIVILGTVMSGVYLLVGGAVTVLFG